MYFIVYIYLTQA